jgi:beta-mannosidase
MDGWDPNLYPRSRFASEFGVQSLCSWRSLLHVTTLGDLDLGIDSEFMIKRQHRIDGNTYLQSQVERRLLPPGQYDFANQEALAKLTYLTQVH